MADDADDDGPCKGRDTLELGPEGPGGLHPYVRHLPNHEIETGFIKQHEPGNDEAAPADLVHLSHCGPGHVYNVERLTHAGPPKANSRAFRDGWDHIFGGKPTVGQA